jgi:hypothetical protein
LYESSKGQLTKTETPNPGPPTLATAHRAKLFTAAAMASAVTCLGAMAGANTR